MSNYVLSVVFISVNGIEMRWNGSYMCGFFVRCIVIRFVSELIVKLKLLIDMLNVSVC